MAEPIETVTIGGVKYVASQVKNSSTEEISYATKTGNFRSKSVFNVELADGTKLSYEEQSPNRKASVFQNEYHTQFFGLRSANIVDTTMYDHYELYGCKGCSVSADRWRVEEGHLWDSLIGTDRDEIEIADRSMGNGEVQKSGNNQVYICERDFYFDNTPKDSGNEVFIIKE